MAARRTDSKQPRFTENEAANIWRGLSAWVKRGQGAEAEKKRPKKEADTRELDKWLSSMWEQEPFMAGAVTTVCMINSHRGWTAIGGDRKVRNLSNLLHRAENGYGWYWLKKKQSLSYLTTNFGGPIELARRKKPSPNTKNPARVTSLYNVDPTLCGPSTDEKYPLEFDGKPWTEHDYYVVRSMPSNLQLLKDAGSCPLYRCLILTEIACGILSHLHKVTHPETSKGVLAVEGYNFQQLTEALMQGKKVGEMFMGTSDHIVLADARKKPSIDFITLSKMPENLDMTQWLWWLISGYALNFGISVTELIDSHSGGIFGRSGAEETSQRGKSTSKGEADFSLQDQALMQSRVASQYPGVQWQYMARDPINEIEDLRIVDKKTEIILKWYEAEQLNDIGEDERLIDARARSPKVLSREEARAWADAWQVFPDCIQPQELDKVELVEDEQQEPDPESVEVRLITETRMTAGDMTRSEMKRRQDFARSQPDVIDGCRADPREPVVQYNWYIDESDVERRVLVPLFSSGYDALKRTVWDLNGAQWQTRADVSLVEELDESLWVDDEYLQDVDDDTLDALIEDAIEDPIEESELEADA